MADDLGNAGAVTGILGGFIEGLNRGLDKRRTREREDALFSLKKQQLELANVREARVSDVAQKNLELRERSVAATEQLLGPKTSEIQSRVGRNILDQETAQKKLEFAGATVELKNKEVEEKLNKARDEKITERNKLIKYLEKNQGNSGTPEYQFKLNEFKRADGAVKDYDSKISQTRLYKVNTKDTAAVRKKLNPMAQNDISTIQKGVTSGQIKTKGQLTQYLQSLNDDTFPDGSLERQELLKTIQQYSNLPDIETGPDLGE